MKCDHPEASRGLGRMEMSNGAPHVVEWCFACESRADKSRFIGAKEIEKRGLSRDLLPLVQSNVDPDNPCVVCGAPGVEYHHWAPSYLADQFEDHGAWPCAYLCRKHHLEWHHVVTPDMSHQRAEEPGLPLGWEGVEVVE